METNIDNDELKTDLHFEQLICKVIMAMPDDVRDRFKVLKLLSDKKTKTSETLRQIEIKYEAIKEELYQIRAAIIAGEHPDQKDIEQFNKRHQQLKNQLGSEVDDDDCAAVEVNTNDIENEKGIPGFWLKVLKAHHLVKDYVKKDDEPILKHLINISGKHLPLPAKFGYELTFTGKIEL
jgi:hypothetical protein